MALSITLVGKVDADALNNAINALIRDIEILRTNFSYVHRRKTQIIRHSASFTLKLLDYSKLDRRSREKRAGKIKRKLQRQLFELENGLLLRGRLIKLAPSQST